MVLFFADSEDALATQIIMKHKQTGLLKDGYYGFSWTTLFFGFFPALIRGDFVTFIGGFAVLVILATMGASIITGLSLSGIPIEVGEMDSYLVGFIIGEFVVIGWAFEYNEHYTKRLIERGYVFAGTLYENELASSAIRVVNPIDKKVGDPNGK